MEDLKLHETTRSLTKTVIEFPERCFNFFVWNINCLEEIRDKINFNCLFRTRTRITLRLRETQYSGNLIFKLIYFVHTDGFLTNVNYYNSHISILHTATQSALRFPLTLLSHTTGEFHGTHTGSILPS